VISVTDDIPAARQRRWAESYATLHTMPVPSDFTLARWRQIVDAVGTFMNRWADEAIRCGWFDVEVFGCHPNLPTARFDCMGLVLILDGCEVVSIDEDGADFVTASGTRQRFHRRPMPRETVPLWRLHS
jgi:hypothetical protein